MPVSHFPPQIQKRIQPRTWNLDGTRSQLTTALVSSWDVIYASDLITTNNNYLNGLGSGVLIGERLGFFIEKDGPDDPFEDPEIIDTYFDFELTGDTNPGQSAGTYTFTKSSLNIVSPGAPTAITGKSNSFTPIAGGRDFSTSFLVNEPPIEKFGPHRHLVYARGPQISNDRVETEVFELRCLAITGLKPSRKYFEPDGFDNEITISGDITVYPNQNTNSIAGWTPTDDIHWRITIKNDAIPQNQWVVIEDTIPVSELSSPNNDGVVASFETLWDGRLENGDFCFVTVEIEARAIVQVATNRNTITPPAKTSILCNSCYDRLLNARGESSESISLHDSPTGDLVTSLNHSSSHAGNDPSSMGYGWFSTENIKVLDLEEDDTDLVYCDEHGMCKRWLLDGSNYEPVLPDNRMAISVNSSSSSAYYTVRWRDGSRREFDDDGNLRKSVDRNGSETVYDRQTSYLAISDGKGRTVYNHYDSGEVQPRIINDNINSSLGRRYVLDYYMDGTEQKQLRSITDPEGNTTEYLYDTAGRVSERTEIRPEEGDRTLSYTYDSPSGARLASMKVTSTKDSSVLELYEVEYSYNVPLTYQSESFVTTKIVTTDLMDSNNPPRELYRAYDHLSRIVAELELLEYDQQDDPVFIVTRYEHNDPEETGNPKDPWLVTKVTAHNGAITEYKYTPRGNLREMIDAQSNETLLTYVEDDDQHPAYATFPDLVTEVRRPAPDRVGAPTTFYSPTRFEYNSTNGNLESIEDALGEFTYLDYNSAGQVTEVIDRRGFKTLMEYDSRANLTKVSVQKSLTPAEDDPSDFRSIEFTYDTYDNVTEVEDDNGNTIKVQYDDIDRPTIITDGNNVDTIFDYVDRVLKEVQLPANSGSATAPRKTEIERDTFGRPIKVFRDKDGSTQEMRVGFSYDGFSQLRALTRIKNQAEKSHTSSYDRQGRTVSSIDPLNQESTAAYEPYCVGFAGTSARGVRRKASFDTLCRLTQLEVGSPDTDPLEVSTASETRTFEYDDLGRVEKTHQSSSTGSRYGQARFGQSRYGGTAGATEERSYEYDSLDRVTKVTFEDGKTMEYLYDEEGNVTQVTENASSATPKVTQFSYFGDGRLYQVTYVRSGGNQVFTYAYDPGGRPLTLTYPASTGIVAHFDDGVSPNTGWDGNGQLKNLRYIKDGTTLIRSFAFDYDPAGNRISQLDVTPAKATSWAYGYDWLDRLEMVKKAEAATVGALGALQLVSVYTYDAADNRVSFEVPALNELYESFYDDADNITRIDKTVGAGSPVTIETFTSDDDGNLETRTEIVSGVPGVVTTYTWDDFNRLAAISTSDNSKKQSHTFGINGFRRKKKDKSDVETTEYAAGLATAVSKVEAAETITYLMGHGLMGLERSTDGAMFYYLVDGISTVRDVVRGTDGAVLASYEFSEYGEKISPANTGGVETQKTFVGGMSVQDEVADTGLMLMGHRFYEPSGPSGGIGRFLNRDPIGFAGSMNLFNYSNNSPISQVDPTGLQTGAGTFSDPSANVEYLDRQADLAVDRGDWLEATFLRALGVFVNQSGATVAQEAGQGWGSGQASAGDSLYYVVVLFGSATGLSSELSAARSLKTAADPCKKGFNAYRAVTQSELDDLAKNGMMFRTPDGIPHKWFFPTQQQANRFAEHLVGEGYETILFVTGTSLKQSTLKQAVIRTFIKWEGKAIKVPSSALPDGPATILGTVK